MGRNGPSLKSGEMFDFTIVPTGEEKDYQWHAPSPLSARGGDAACWGENGVKYTEEYLANYLEEVWEKAVS